jgi:queuine/archaeosine tRNA-ribosyltransferase
MTNIVPTKDFIFFPAISIATHTQIMKANWKVKNKSPRFYLNNVPKEDLLFHHPYILTSAAHNFKHMDFSKQIGINDKTKDVNLIFGDSGGFQIKTGVIKDTDEIKNSLYSWMEQNVSLAPIIDHPPTHPDGKIISDEEFDSYLKKTIINLDVLMKRKTRDSVLWLNVIQGREYRHRKHWFDNVKDYNLGGWALGSLKSNPFILLTAFATLLDSREFENKNRNKHLHFFGITATRAMPYMIYIKHKMNKIGYTTNVSMDSSYATQNGGWGKYLLFPSATGFTSYHLSNKVIGKFQDVELPCYCPICSGINLKDILNEKALTNEKESFYYNVVQSHNVFVLKEYVRNIQSLIFTDSPELWASCFKSEQLKVFKIIDKMFDNIGKSYKVLEDNHQFLNKIDLEVDDNKEEMTNFFSDFT